VSAFAPEKAFADAVLIFEHGLGAVPISERAKPLVVHALDWYGRQMSPSLSRRESQELGGWGPTRQINLEESGELESFLDGSLRRISTASFCRRLIAVAILTHPLDGPERRARQSLIRYRTHRKPTPQELEGLRRGNARRATEAQQRRKTGAAGSALTHFKKKAGQ